MKVSEISNALNKIAPNCLAEKWDNTGLLVGDGSAKAQTVLFCIDLTEAVLAEAIRRKADMVMAYHSIIFKPISSVTAAANPIVYKAAANRIPIYSTHTAWDVVIGGANDILADALGMGKTREPLEAILSSDAYKVVVFMPESDLEAVRNAAFAAGAGIYGPGALYSRCGFHTDGTGSFLPGNSAKPAIGKKGALAEVSEVRWETICPKSRISGVISAIHAAHSYEQPAIDIIELTDLQPGTGIGRAGELEKPMPLKSFMELIKTACNVDKILVSGDSNIAPRGKVRKIAVGCGACGSMYKYAAAAGCDVFVTGEMRHHEALAAASCGLVAVCTGHSNTERLTLKHMARMLKKHLPGVKTLISNKDRDPFKIV